MKATAGKARIETEDRKKNASALLASTEKRAELPLAVAPVTQLAVAPVTQKASSPSFFFWPTLPIAMMMRLMFGTRQTATSK